MPAAGSSSPSASPPPASRRRSRGRGLRRIVIAGVILVAVALGGLAAARGVILRTALDAALAAYDMADVRYRITSVGFTATRFVDIQAGAEIALEDVTLHYHPLRLFRVEIDAVTIGGLRLDLTRGLPAILRQSSARAAPGGAPAALPRLPPIRLIDGVARVPGNGVVTIGEARLTPRGTAYDLGVAHLEVTAASQRFALRDIGARIEGPGSAAAGQPPLASFTVASLRHEATAPMIVPMSLRGAVHHDGAVWRVAATAQGHATARLEFAASYDTAQGLAEGRVTVPPLHFVPGALQPDDLSPRLATMTDARGEVGGHFAFRRREGRLELSGNWSIERLGFVLDGVPVQSLSARLSLTGDDDPAHAVIRVAEARMELAGGALTVHKTEVRPMADRNRIVLELAGLDVGEILAALDIDGVGGEGRIDGQIPLVVSGRSVAVETARIAARGPGVLRIRSENAKTALAQGGADANLLLQALADFRFERLSLTIDKPMEGESRLALTTAGHNPAVLDGHPFNINVTVTTNLDKLLDVFSEGSRLSQAAIRAIVGARRSASPDGSR